MFVWPTSELPICPVGKPTSGPWVIRVACGQVWIIRSKLGVSARTGALASVRSDRPQPSRMHRTTGFALLMFFACFRLDEGVLAFVGGGVKRRKATPGANRVKSLGKSQAAALGIVSV